MVVQETLDWLDKNQLAMKDEFETKQEEPESVVNPILSKICQDAGGGGGMPEGGMPGGGLDRNPENTIFDAKRIIGRKFTDPVMQSGRTKRTLPSQLVSLHVVCKSRLRESNEGSCGMDSKMQEIH